MPGTRQADDAGIQLGRTGGWEKGGRVLTRAAYVKVIVEGHSSRSQLKVKDVGSKMGPEPVYQHKS